MNQTKYDEFVNLWENPEKGHGVLMNLGKGMTQAADVASQQGIGLKEGGGPRFPQLQHSGVHSEMGDETSTMLSPRSAVDGLDAPATQVDQVVGNDASAAQSLAGESAESPQIAAETSPNDSPQVVPQVVKQPSGGIQALKDFLGVFGVGGASPVALRQAQGSALGQPDGFDGSGMPGAGMDFDQQVAGEQVGMLAGFDGTQPMGEEVAEEQSGGVDDGIDDFGNEMGMKELIDAVTSRVTKEVASAVGVQLQQLSQTQAQASKEKDGAVLGKLDALTKEFQALQVDNAEMRRELDQIVGTMPQSASIAHFRATGEVPDNNTRGLGLDAAKQYEYAVAQYDPLVVQTFMR